MKRVKKRGFTLMEITTVTIILGLVAAFAIPSYNKAVEKQYSRQVINNMHTLKGAAEMYRARNSKWAPNDGYLADSLGDVNGLLGTNISDSYFTYEYSLDGDTLHITTSRNSTNNNGFSYRFDRRVDYVSGADELHCNPCPDWPTEAHPGTF